MNWEIFFEIHQNLPREGPGRNRYTRQAYKMLPELNEPCILDVGCGPGAPTLELARLSQGKIIGMDTHLSYLRRLVRTAEEEGLSDRVKAVRGSMLEMGFLKKSFDLIWSEGAIYIIGFEKGLSEWRCLLKPGGYLVVHELTWLSPDPPKEIYDYWKRLYAGIRTVPENLKKIPGLGYEVMGHFTLPEDAWWIEYYHPLEKRIQMLREKYPKDPKVLALLEEEQKEIDMYKKYQKWYGSVFFVMKKT
jgi:SAM-dependent methyltransferase